jgi:hypothetical protein
MVVWPFGTEDNDRRFLVTAATSTNLTVEPWEGGGDVDNEGPILCDLTGYFLDPDGMESWPVEMVNANGFDDGFTGIPTPITDFPFLASVDGQVYGDLAHHFYLSQRTDDPDKRYIDVTRADDGASGTVTLSLTDIAVSDLGLEDATSTQNEDQLTRILKNVTLYAARISDGAIQYVNLLEATLASV